MTSPNRPRSFQEIILALQTYWAGQGCAVLQPYDMEVGAGTFHPELDPTHAVMSVIGIVFVPFVIGDVVERFTGTSPFQAAFVEERTAAVRSQLRAALVVKKK